MHGPVRQNKNYIIIAIHSCKPSWFNQEFPIFGCCPISPTLPISCKTRKKTLRKKARVKYSYGMWPVKVEVKKSQKRISLTTQVPLPLILWAPLWQWSNGFPSGSVLSRTPLVSLWLILNLWTKIPTPPPQWMCLRSHLLFKNVTYICLLQNKFPFFQLFSIGMWACWIMFTMLQLRDK